MPGTTLPANLTDIVSKLVARVERLERAIQNLTASKTSGSGFPVGPYDDGTATYEMYVFAPGFLVTSATDDGSGNKALQAQLANATTAQSIQDAAVGSDLARVDAAATTTYGEAALTATNNASASAQVRVRSTNSGTQIVDVTGTTITIGHAPTLVLGFFGVGGSAQVATPATLGDVIALLQAYGLSA